MKSLPKFVQTIILLGLTAVMLLGITMVTERMNAIREAEGLTDAAIPENAPPVVAFTTVALGSFRGLVADYLWLRSAQAKEQGNYFEMVQLASWIVKLQPRFTGATAYLAWNMAYNVSVTFNDFEDRWRWVQRGIELIRDEALFYNPGDPTLYKELGWLYQHKLGQEMDDANRYYKFQLATQIMEVVGEWPPDWERLAETPRDKAALYETLSADQKESLENILAEKQLTLAELESKFRQSAGMPEEIAEAMRDAGLLEDLQYYFRQRWLRQAYKLKAELIFELNQEYGALDWRLPEAHAIYWATRGLRASEEKVDMACERMIFQSLANAFRGGRLIYVEGSDAIEITPNTDIVDAVNEAYLKTLERHKNQTGAQAGYENFLIDATVTLYTFGKTRKAREYLGKLRDKYDNMRYRLPLNRFVLREIAGDIRAATYDQGQALVQGYLYQMYRALAFGDMERGESFESLARAIWERYMAEAPESGRRALPPYDQMKNNMYEQCQERFPPALRERLKQVARTYTGAE